MRAIVTGGAGFVGSHLCDRLLAEGWEVVAVDDLSSGHAANLDSRVQLIEHDCADPAVVEQLPPGGADVVFHLASHVGQQYSFDRPIHDLRVNAGATIILLEWCRTKVVPKFVFASTMNVYGDPPSLPATEASPVDPPSPYAVGKLASEHLCRIYDTLGVGTTSLRLFNTYGPRQDLANRMQGMVSIYMAYVLAGEPILVRGSGDRFRDFVYVDDAVDAFVRSADRRADGRVYNMASGTRTTVNELLAKIVAAAGEDPATYPIEWGEPTTNDQFGCYGDPSLIGRELGWAPRITLDEGLLRMTDWARSVVV